MLSSLLFFSIPRHLRLFLAFNRSPIDPPVPMRSPVYTLAALAAFATCALSHPSHSPSSSSTFSLSRRSGPLAKQRLQRRASLRSSSAHTQPTHLPYVEDMDEPALLAAMANDDELHRRNILNSVPGSSVLTLVSLDGILGSLGSGASSMKGHERKIRMFPPCFPSFFTSSLAKTD